MNEGERGGKQVAVSFVCMGNICRSPTAEAVMRHLVREAGLQDAITLDSAGTGAWHVGEQRDPRSRAVAKRRGMPITGPARQFGRPRQCGGAGRHGFSDRNCPLRFGYAPDQPSPCP